MQPIRSYISLLKHRADVFDNKMTISVAVPIFLFISSFFDRWNIHPVGLIKVSTAIALWADAREDGKEHHLPLAILRPLISGW